MKIYWHSYELKPSGSSHFSMRIGALLRVDFPDGKTGYADCHPWTSFGDEPLMEQLRKATRGSLTPITRNSLRFARLDAEARAEGKNLFHALKIPPSHHLIVNLSTFKLDEAIGYKRVKVKLGSNLAEEIVQIKSLAELLNGTDILIRPDFNYKIHLSEFEGFLSGIGSAIHKLDFCEDPFYYDFHTWKTIQDRFHINLACDRDAEFALNKTQAAKFLVIKPAVHPCLHFPNSIPQQRLVYTSYLDHPLGQVSAAYEAAIAAARHPNFVDFCGLLSHRVYEPNPFSESLGCKNMLLIPPDGTGFGFDDLLHKLSWRKLS